MICNSCVFPIFPNIWLVWEMRDERCCVRSVCWCEGQWGTVRDSEGRSGYICCPPSGRNIFSRVPSLDLYLSQTWLYQEIYTIYTHLHWPAQVAGTVLHTQPTALLLTIVNSLRNVHSFMGIILLLQFCFKESKL